MRGESRCAGRLVCCVYEVPIWKFPSASSLLELSSLRCLAAALTPCSHVTHKLTFLLLFILNFFSQKSILKYSAPPFKITPFPFFDLSQIIGSFWLFKLKDGGGSSHSRWLQVMRATRSIPHTEANRIKCVHYCAVAECLARILLRLLVVPRV